MTSQPSQEKAHSHHRHTQTTKQTSPTLVHLTAPNNIRQAPRARVSHTP
jgi:hypothetical protein